MRLRDPVQTYRAQRVASHPAVWAVLCLATVMPLRSVSAATAGATARASTTTSISHCASQATITPIDTAPDGVSLFRLETARGSMLARQGTGLRSEDSGGPLFVISVLDTTFDADNNAATVKDTLIVPVGATVRWQLVSGIHTVTNGRDSGDPQAGMQFSVLLGAGATTFDSTFTQPDTLDYFCFFHEPVMVGVVMIQEGVDAGDPADPTGSRRAAWFSRPPAPNPSRSGTAFALSLSRPKEAVIEVRDAAGRLVRALHRGPLGAGEHAFTWNGRTEAGRRAAPGAYWLSARGSGFHVSRPFTLLD
jgi:plastocyanin